MRRFRPSHDSTEMALANFALTFAKALLVFCVIMFLLISPQQGHDGTKPKAEFLVTVDWASEGKYDVDTWIRAPDGNEINYTHKESGVVFLERDDLGNECDVTTSNGKPLDICEEIVVLRGVVPGEYVIALHLFSAFGSTTPTVTRPIAVQIKVEKLNPTVQVMWKTTVVLNRVRQEMDIVRFTVVTNGNLTDFDTDELPPLIYTGGEH